MAASEPESVLSPVVRAHISHAVIATYVADAAAAVPGVAALAGGKPVRVSSAVPERGPVDIEVRIVLAAGFAVPAVAHALHVAVGAYLESMVAVAVGRLLVVVDEVAGAHDAAE